MAGTKDGATAVEDDAALQNQKAKERSEEYRQLFHLPPEESLIADFNCALQKKILLQGHMYLFERYVCFYSNIFGYEKKKIIPLKDVTCVRKARTASVFPNAIEIVSWGKKHFFASFLSRDEAFRLIMDGWVQYSSHAKLFLNAQGSLASLAMSPQSRTSGADSGANSQNSWQSPLLMTRLEAGGNYESRVDEMAAKISASAEAVEQGPSQALREHDGGDCLLEDEGTTSSSSSVGQQQSVLWEIQDSDAPSLPDSYKTVAEAEFSVDVEDFFHLFFSNEGIGFAKDFHTKCGDDDFRCTQWIHHRQFGHARDISFRHPINFYFGPKSTYCHEAQRFRVYRNNHMVLETSQQMTDIPYGDYFRVEVRWDVERLDCNGQFHSIVRVSIDVTFSKKTFWKSKIEQGTYDESKGAYNTWIQLAQGVLENMKSSAAKHQDGNETSESLTGHEVNREDHVEVPSEARQELNNIDNVHTSAARNTLHSQGVLELQKQPEWAMKASSIVQNVVDKLSALDWRAGKKHMKLVLFMLVAVAIVSLQVGIIITLMWSPNAKPAPVAYNSYEAFNMGIRYHGGSEREETLGWLERRARHIKEEIVMTELRLQDLHQDLAALKVHAEKIEGHLSKTSLECGSTQTNL
ncbi:hypothetical protein KC19_10G038300 [Ceratodon purpureus]|uniref:VASt domain-containing protein n=1 Tax=Ceratodon purpureus TaxID=3225 RepID=A0A8T0GGJ6_CERPU|nr:hypothetical protein KC19_10G038300 [Ceratodon purpureus]